MSVISVKGLTKSFGENQVLRQVDLSLAEGEFLTIFGPNGAGKTTLIKIISTLTKASQGEVTVLGHDVAQKSDLIRRHIGMIGHHTFLYDDLTAEENLFFYGRLYEVAELKKKIESSLEEVGLAHRHKDQVRGFSRGMQQRLAIARAMLHDPPILLLDEPYTGLDQNAAYILTSWLERLRKQNRTTIMVTHNIERGLQLADRVVIIHSGKIRYAVQSNIPNLTAFKEIYQKTVEGRQKNDVR